MLTCSRWKMITFVLLVIVHVVYSGVYVFDDSRGLGRKFDGVGAISGGGATSKLLVNYPQKQRDEIFDYLFKPDFGAALHLLKVEIGSDGESTDGSEATHMRSPNEENYERGYEWWFMQEAKKRNPDLKLIGLPWAWPAWLGGTSADVFLNPEQTALYVVKWILAAKSKYDLHIDYVGIWNESPYTTKYIKILRQVLDQHSLQDTLIVAADDIRDWDEISSQVLADPDLAEAIYAIGVHYPGYNSSLLALDTGKQLWASEDKSHDLYLRWNLNYVDGFMTGTVMWPVLSAFYKGLPWEGTGLMNASEPWSGHYTVFPYVHLAAHTTQFTKPGWTFLRHGSGVGRFRNGGIYVSLISPDRKDFTIVIETVTANDTWGEVPSENVTFQLTGSFASITELNFWFTRLDMDNTSNSYLFEKQAPVKIVDGRFSLYIGANRVYTLTTLTTGRKGSYPPPPPSQRFPLPYYENFENYREYEEPYMISPQTGAYEVTTVGGTHGKVMRQMTWQRPVPWYWCHIEYAGITYAVIGDYYWSDIYIESEVFINMTWPSRSNGVFLAARVGEGGCKANNATGVFFYFYPENKTYILSSDLERKHVLSQGPLLNASTEWNKIALVVKGSNAFGTLNGEQVFSVSSIPPTVRSGFTAVGTGSYGAADFDNIEILQPA